MSHYCHYPRVSTDTSGIGNRDLYYLAGMMSQVQTQIALTLHWEEVLGASLQPGDCGRLSSHSDGMDLLLYLPATE